MVDSHCIIYVKSSLLNNEFEYEILLNMFLKVKTRIITVGTQSICSLWRQAWACLERNVPSF